MTAFQLAPSPRLFLFPIEEILIFDRITYADSS
jgi:hypothetical protein